MSNSYVFIANGDSCPLCAALDGSVVPDGYRAHPGCTCNTVRMDDGERTCEFEFDESRIEPGHPSFGGFLVVMDLTVTCPDGTSHTLSDWAGTGLNRLRAGEADEFLEDLAHEACDELCDGADSPDDFLCC